MITKDNELGKRVKASMLKIKDYLRVFPKSLEELANDKQVVKNLLSEKGSKIIYYQKHEIVVDVEMMKALMEVNVNNRTIKINNVEKIVESLLSGTYVESSDPVVIDEDMTVVSGQHRIVAGLITGIPFKALVVAGLPMRGREYVDRGVSRSVSDSFSCSGFCERDKHFNSLINCFVNVVDKQVLDMPTIKELMLIEKVSKTMDFIVELNHKKFGKKINKLRAPVMGVIGRAYYLGADPVKLSRFVEILKMTSGEILENWSSMTDDEKAVKYFSDWLNKKFYGEYGNKRTVTRCTFALKNFLTDGAKIVVDDKFYTELGMDKYGETRLCPFEKVNDYENNAEHDPFFVKDFDGLREYYSEVKGKLKK